MSFLNNWLKGHRTLQRLLLMLRIAWQVSLAFLGVRAKSQS
jgi:hypothetical protein